MKTAASTLDKKTAGIILAGGIGQRFGSALPKQFVRIARKPVLYYSLRAFSQIPQKEMSHIVLVAPASHIKEARSIVRRYFPREHRIDVVVGGLHRIHSYFAGVDFLEKNGMFDTVVAHDAARPLITARDVLSCLKSFKKKHADAMLVTRPLPESLFQENRSGVRCIPRDGYSLGQSPNVFTWAVLKKVRARYRGRERSLGATLDLVQLISEIRGTRVLSTTLDHANTKLTHLQDLKTIEIALKNSI